MVFEGPQNIMRNKIFLICHEFSPHQGSECKSGWNTVLQLNKIADLTIVAAETNQWGTQNYRQAVERESDNSSLNIIWIPQPRIYNRPKGFGSNIFVQVIYFFRLRGWHSKVIEELKCHKIDVLHYFNHISFRAYDKRFNSLAPKIVIGPVSGTQILPGGFLTFGFIYNCNLILRSAINRLHRLFKRSAFKSPNILTIFAVTKDDVSYFKKIHSHVVPLSDMAQDLKADQIEESGYKHSENKKTKLLWVGRLDNLKGLDILLEVFKRSDRVNKYYELTVLGDGANFARYQAAIIRYDLSIILKRQVPFAFVKDFMLQSDLMVHSSLKEAGGAVLNEAMSNGLPVMCHDSFGFSLFDDQFLIKIPFISFETSVQVFQKELENIARNHRVLSQLRNNIKNNFMPTTWEDHAMIINKEYK